MTTEITEIRVTFGNGVKKEEYGALKKAEVTLTAVVADGGDGLELLGRVSDIAQAKVAELLGLAPTTAALAAPSAPTKTTRKTPPKTDPAGGGAGAEQPATTRPTEPTQPPVDETTSGFDAPVADKGPADGFDAVADAVAPADEWGSEAADISDKDLTDACGKKASALAEGGDSTGAVKIRELIGKFNPDPTKKFSLVEIAQAQRSDFLTKLAAIA